MSVFSILFVHLRQEYSIACYGRSSDLSRLLRLPNNEVSGYECNKHTFAKGLTAAGTVPDSHRIPVNPSSCTELGSR